MLVEKQEIAHNPINMLYNANDPESLFYDFLVYGRGGRVMTIQEHTSMAKKTKKYNFDG